jgi:hypothetical protein
VDHFDQIGASAVEFADVALGGALAGEGILIHCEFFGFWNSVVEVAVEPEEVDAPLRFFAEIVFDGDVGINVCGEPDEFYEVCGIHGEVLVELSWGCEAFEVGNLLEGRTSMNGSVLFPSDLEKLLFIGGRG